MEDIGQEKVTLLVVSTTFLAPFPWPLGMQTLCLLYLPQEFYHLDRLSSKWYFMFTSLELCILLRVRLRSVSVYHLGYGHNLHDDGVWCTFSEQRKLPLAMDGFSRCRVDIDLRFPLLHFLFFTKQNERPLTGSALLWVHDFILRRTVFYVRNHWHMGSQLSL